MVRIDFSSEEPHRQVDFDRVMTSGSLCGVVVGTLARNVRDMDLIPALGEIFPISITSMTLDPKQATCCMVVEPTPCL